MDWKDEDGSQHGSNTVSVRPLSSADDANYAVLGCSRPLFSAKIVTKQTLPNKSQPLYRLIQRSLGNSPRFKGEIPATGTFLQQLTSSSMLAGEDTEGRAAELGLLSWLLRRKNAHSLLIF